MGIARANFISSEKFIELPHLNHLFMASNKKVIYSRVLPLTPCILYFFFDIDRTKISILHKTKSYWPFILRFKWIWCYWIIWCGSKFTYLRYYSWIHGSWWQTLGKFQLTLIVFNRIPITLLTSWIIYKQYKPANTLQIASNYTSTYIYFICRVNVAQSTLFT